MYTRAPMCTHAMYIYGFCAPGSVSLRLVCQHVKEHRQSSFDDAKLGTKKMRSNLLKRIR